MLDTLKTRVVELEELGRGAGFKIADQPEEVDPRERIGFLANLLDLDAGLAFDMGWTPVMEAD